MYENFLLKKEENKSNLLICMLTLLLEKESRQKNTKIEAKNRF